MTAIARNPRETVRDLGTLLLIATVFLWLGYSLAT